MVPTVLSREQVRRLDRAAVEQYGISGLVLMENAGAGCVGKLLELGIDGPIVICCGKGNNGGDGLVMARHLDCKGVEVQILLCCQPRELLGDAAENFEILAKSNVPIDFIHEQSNQAQIAAQLGDADWIVDALLGIGSRGEPRPPLKQVLRTLNAHPAQKFAVDVPSGLDCNTGQPAKTTFQADHTGTLVLPKPGFLVPAAQRFLGQLHVIDIGLPRQLIQEIASDEIDSG